MKTYELIDSICYRDGYVSNVESMEPGTLVQAEFVERAVGWGTADSIVQVDGEYFLARRCRKELLIQINRGGHWETVIADDLPATVREEMSVEILNGTHDIDDFLAGDGQHYRWEVVEH